ncbi:MAG: C25 family cysteine peptidase, partial [Bacteroidota bacterium]|nr:C25 family cysteine peptidase [Bacteroidota bacterium]
MLWGTVVLGLSGVATAAAVVQQSLASEGIALHLNFVRAQVSVLPSGQAFAQLNEPGATLLPDSSVAAAECLAFLVALPSPGQLPEVRFEVLHRREWQSVRLASVGELLRERPGPPVQPITPFVRLEYLGIWRGIPLALLRICPWTYEPGDQRLQLWSKLRVHVRYREPVKVSGEPRWAVGEREFVRLILNSDHAQAFRQCETLRAAESLFRFEEPVLHLTTTRDGIAMVTLNDVLRLMPEWRDAPAERLELLWRGTPVPILLRDTNGKLDEVDTLFFFGRRAAGDTTWLDFYAAGESFFLVLRDSGLGRRLAAFAEGGNDTGTPVQILPMVVHWERERVYVQGVNEGFLRYRTESAPGEGWYWAVLRAGGSPWRDSLQLPSADTVWLSLQGYAFNRVPVCAPEHRWQIVLNGDTLSALQASGWGPLVWQSALEPGKWSAGWNHCAVYSLSADTGVVCSAAEQAVDMWRLRLRPRPVAIGGVWHGTAAAGERGGSMTVHGFGSSPVVLLDTLRARAAVLSGDPEVTARVAARSGAQPRVEAFIGDSLVARWTEAGILLLWWQPPRYELQQRWVRMGASGVYQLVRQLPPGTLIVWASAAEPPADVLLLLQSWGLRKGERAARGDAWVWALRVGDTTDVVEHSAVPGSWANLLWARFGVGGQYRVTFALPPNDTAVVWAAQAGLWERPLLERIEPTSLLDPEPQADVILVTPPQLWAAAQRWAEYRERTRKVRVRIVSTRDIAVAFGHGRLSPHAIKEFLRYAYTQWSPPAPQFLLLLGSANWDTRNILGYSKPNLVPSYGVPPSDYWYTLLDG